VNLFHLSSDLISELDNFPVLNSIKDRISLAQFKRNSLVPDLIDSPPTTRLHVKWASNDNTAEANFGNILEPKQVDDFFLLWVGLFFGLFWKISRNINKTLTQPEITWDNADSQSFYTLLMVDIFPVDSPDQVTFLHWIVVNIPGDKINMGEHRVE
jgi:hypothetical protein